MNTSLRTLEEQAQFLLHTDLEEIWPTQNQELLRALHLLTRDGKLNQDARRKLKQIYHFLRLLLPVLKAHTQEDSLIVDVGAGKGYLGFLIYDLWLKPTGLGSLTNIEIRGDLVETTNTLARQMGFTRLETIQSAIRDADSKLSGKVPSLVTALHACDTATDDAILMGLRSQSSAIAVVPCCQAEVARLLTKTKLDDPGLWQLWRHPHHAREFGSHLTNVIRALVLETHGYEVTVTELAGWEHSLKNELILALKPTRETVETKKATENAKTRLKSILKNFPIEPTLVRNLADFS